MDAGRDLDEKVAEMLGVAPTVLVIGSRDSGVSAAVCENPLHGPFYTRADVVRWVAEHPDYSLGEWRRYRPYSTDIAAAWEVVNHMLDRKWHVDLIAGDHMRPLWYCKVFTRYHWSSPKTNSFTAGADTAPLAICLAALEAVGDQ